MIIYIVKISGYTIRNPYDAEYWKPYLKSFGTYLETTTNPAFAKIWMKRETAEKNAEKAVKYLRDEDGLHYSHPNVRAEVIAVEFNILNP